MEKSFEDKFNEINYQTERIEEKLNFLQEKIPSNNRDPEKTFTFARPNLTALKGLHFEPETLKALNDDQSKFRRGWKSHLLNELVKDYYKRKGKL
ncbi:hypothetical protein DFO73_102283 [Cytobacillus oceanisediminis]|uniref:Uncharacterized protein n=1 Tax=Cytobacillus oceanisediminis TaxID=665099 RepID=A0A2V3A4W0_9BACI|nr:hypothetical protein [Cytobacillus oceanisediminis]PWW31287.1 hypothetical protein DFO73_102283 [Cytobacillus oceanisediminis]